ncbi:MAG: hypothetical protein QOE66_2896, partial [Chloroflexota bacterium]|nr:hypothetical protein [Chloroflexota bacterium]
EVVAVTMRRAGAVFDPWRLRQSLLRHDEAWRTLAADVRDDLQGQSIEASLERLKDWDRKLSKGMHTARFFEVWLNTCSPSQLRAAVADRAADLKHLDLPWWDSAKVAGAPDDLRERFARLVPMAPFEVGTLPGFRGWLLPSKPGARRAEPDDFAALDPDGPPGPHRGPLSPFGLFRWRCLEALTIFSHPDETLDSRWERLKTWTRELPLGRLEPVDRYRFLGWLIVGFPRLDPDRIARLASWLFKSGINDPECRWLNRWYEDLKDLGPLDGALRGERAPLVGELRNELRNVIRDAAERARKTGTSGSP